MNLFHRCLQAAFCFLLVAGSTATLADVHWVESPDEMDMVRLTDWDMSGDHVRLLYQSMPDLEQSASGNWTVTIYVAELYPDGRVENRGIHTSKRIFSSSIMQRGGNKAYLVAAPAHGDRAATLETWSMDDGTLLSSVSSDALIAPGGSAQTIFPTGDGHFFIVTHSTQSARGGQPTTVTWIKMNERGEVIARGEWSNPTAVSGITGGFPAAAGGMGIVLGMSLANGATALQTDIEGVQPFEIAGRKIEARVFSETRMLVTDSNGALRWQSPALERMMMWDGDTAIPQGLPIDQMMAQNQEQMALMAQVNLDNKGERTLATRAIDHYVDVQKTQTGYGLLARQAADQSLDPPIHGMWFIEIDDDGSLKRELRLEHIADHLNAQIARFLPTDDGGLLVAGNRQDGNNTLHVTAMDPSGTGKWTSRVGIKGTHFRGIAGTADTPWVFGQGWREERGKNLIWVERIDPATATKITVSASSSTGVSSSAESSSTTASPAKPTLPPGFELPAVPEGCTCSCEEFANLQERLDGMKSLPQTEMIAMAQSPAYQQAISCTSGCAMAYMQCN